MPSESFGQARFDSDCCSSQPTDDCHRRDIEIGFLGMPLLQNSIHMICHAPRLAIAKHLGNIA